MNPYEKRAIQICVDDGLRWDELMSQSRKPHIVAVRRKIARELRAMGCSLPFIAGVLKRHHSAVMHLIDNRKKRRKSSAVKARGFDPIHMGC